MFFLMPIFFWCLRRPWSRQCGSSTPCWKVKDVDEHLISRVPRFDVAGQVICPQNLKLKVLSVDAGVNAFPHDQFLVLWFFQMHSRQRLDEPSRAWPEIRRGAVTECKQQKPRSDSLAECIEGLLFILDSQPQCVDAVLRVGLPSPFHIDIVDETVMERRNNVLAAYDILPLKNTEKIKVKLVQYLTHGMTQIFEMSLLALGLANHGFQVGDDTKGLKNGGREEQLGVWIIQNYQAVKSGDWGKNLGIAKQRGMININQQPILRMRTRPTQQWVQYIARRTRRTRRIQYACIMYILDKSMTDGQSNLKIRWTEMSESPTK